MAKLQTNRIHFSGIKNYFDIAFIKWCHIAKVKCLMLASLNHLTMFGIFFIIFHIFGSVSQCFFKTKLNRFLLKILKNKLWWAFLFIYIPYMEFWGFYVAIRHFSYHNTNEEFGVIKHAQLFLMQCQFT